MTITFILGNGFDIQLGLHSRYSDFLNEYILPTGRESDCIKKFKKMLKEDTECKWWSDAEKAMGQYLNKFSNNNVDEYYEQIVDFEEKMIEFLENQQARCKFDQSEKIQHIFSDFVLHSFEDVLLNRSSELEICDIAEGNEINFLSFNYTNLIDRIVAQFPNKTMRSRSIQHSTYHDKIGKVVHVHGTLDSQVIMGVNDESQLNTTGGISINEQLKWYMVKPAQNSSTNSKWDVAGKKIIDNSKIIAIYGVSFGETDKMWWELLGKWLKQSTSHKMVIFRRSKGEILNTRIPGHLLRFEDDVRRDILGKLLVEEEDVESLRNQIFVVLDTTRLNLKDILISPIQTIYQESTPKEETAVSDQESALVRT